MRMTYKIKVTNKRGAYLSKKFNTKKEAEKVLKANRLSDKKINMAGMRRLSDGKLVNIKNKYKLMKVK